jgi:hypothetical protein
LEPCAHVAVPLAEQVLDGAGMQQYPPDPGCGPQSRWGSGYTGSVFAGQIVRLLHVPPALAHVACATASMQVARHWAIESKTPVPPGQKHRLSHCPVRGSYQYCAVQFVCRLHAFAFAARSQAAGSVWLTAASPPSTDGDPSGALTEASVT